MNVARWMGGVGVVVLSLGAGCAPPAIDAETRHGLGSHLDSTDGVSGSIDFDAGHTLYVDLDRLAADEGIAADALVHDQGAHGYSIVIPPTAMKGGYYQSELAGKIRDVQNRMKTESAIFWVAFPFTNARRQQLAKIAVIDDTDPDYTGLAIGLSLPAGSDVRSAFGTSHFDFKDVVPKLSDITISNEGKGDIAKLSNIDVGFDNFGVDLESGGIKKAFPAGHARADVTFFPANGNTAEYTFPDTFYRPFVFTPGPIPFPIEVSLTLSAGFGVSFSNAAPDAPPTGFTFHFDLQFDGNGGAPRADVQLVGGDLADVNATAYMFFKADVALYETIHGVAKIEAPALFVARSGCTGMPRLGLGFLTSVGAGLGAGDFRVDASVDGPGCLLWSNTGGSGACVSAQGSEALMADLASRACP